VQSAAPAIQLLPAQAARRKTAKATTAAAEAATRGQACRVKAQAITVAEKGGRDLLAGSQSNSALLDTELNTGESLARFDCLCSTAGSCCTRWLPEAGAEPEVCPNHLPVAHL